MNKLPPQETTYLTELLQYVNDTEDYEDKKALINQYYLKDNVHANLLQAFIELMWHPDIHWELPKGNPPYTPASVHVTESPSSLFKAVRELSVLFRDGASFMHDANRRELYYVHILESLSTDEAKLLCEVRNRKLTSYPNISLPIFAELFPQFLPDDVVHNAVEQTKKPVSSNPKKEQEPSEDGVKKRGRPSKV